MGRIYINTERLDSVEAMLQKLIDTEDIVLEQKVLPAGADVLLNAVRDQAPQRSDGRHIKKKLETRIKSGPDGPWALVGVWASGEEEPVAYFVEYGHAGPKPAPPHPYMAPAAEQAEVAVMEAVMNALYEYMEGL